MYEEEMVRLEGVLRSVNSDFKKLLTAYKQEGQQLKVSLEAFSDTVHYLWTCSEDWHKKLK